MDGKRLTSFGEFFFRATLRKIGALCEAVETFRAAREMLQRGQDGSTAGFIVASALDSMEGREGGEDKSER